MGKTEKNKKGFQSVPKELKRDKRNVFKLNQLEQEKLKAYLTNNGLTLADLIRDRLKDVIS